MTPDLLWILPAAALLAGGWFAAAWHYKRKLNGVQAQIKAIRHTAAEHANQARRQIGQLQAELAARPPIGAARRAAAPAAPPPASAAEARRAAAEQLVPDHGFAPTAVAANHGFARTQVLE